MNQSPVGLSSGGFSSMLNKFARIIVQEDQKSVQNMYGFFIATRGVVSLINGPVAGSLITTDNSGAKDFQPLIIYCGVLMCICTVGVLFKAFHIPQTKADSQVEHVWVFFFNYGLQWTPSVSQVIKGWQVYGFLGFLEEIISNLCKRLSFGIEKVTWIMTKFGFLHMSHVLIKCFPSLGFHVVLVYMYRSHSHKSMWCLPRYIPHHMDGICDE